jgi:hypothetical protein
MSPISPTTVARPKPTVRVSRLICGRGHTVWGSPDLP